MSIEALRNIRLTLLLATLLACILCGCSDSGIEPADSADSDGIITVVLRVPIAASPLISRSDPMPGEDGNGREQGILNENLIHDVNVFFYLGEGLNPDDASVKVYGIYVPSMDSHQVESEELPLEKRYTIRLNPGELPAGSQEVLEATSAVSFITVVNAGTDLSHTFGSLAELRRYDGFDSAWVNNRVGSLSAADCDRFVMTTAYDADANGIVNIGDSPRNVGSSRLVKTGGNVGGQEWTGETTVQRICARIDLMYNASNTVGPDAEAMSIEGLDYSVDNTENIVHLTNALPVNVMQYPSYLLTQVTEAIPSIWTETGLGKITWGGVEKSSGSPASPANYVIDPRTLQKEGVVSASTIDSWYGASSVTNVRTRITDADAGVLRSYFSSRLPAAETGYGCTHMTILGYANENIQGPGQYRSDYLTGIVFRAVYQPRKWLRLRDGSFVEENITDAAWASMDDKSFTRYQPIARGTDVITDSRALYFATPADALSYSAAHPEDRAILTHYEGGVCYYNLWLRHYNDESADPQQSYPMEYAIVRNNIYRVALSFAGPGNPQPDLREPDTMMARIFVRKWNLRTETQPLQF